MFTLYFFVEKSDRLFVKRKRAYKKSVEDNATAPNINWSSLIFSLSNNFWRCIVGTSTGSLKQFAVFHKVGESEVNDFDDFVGSDEDVLGLKIAMSDEIVMGVVNSADDLFEEEPCIFFADLIELDIVVQFASFSQFHDDKYVIAGVEDFVKFDDVVVVDELEDSYLPFDLNRPVCTLEIICLLFIFRLLIILTATRTPVRSCRASIYLNEYISPSQTRLFRWSFPKCNARYAPHPSKYIIKTALLQA